MPTIDHPSVAIKFDSAATARRAARAFGLGILRHSGPTSADQAYSNGYSLSLEAQRPLAAPSGLSRIAAGAWDVGASEAAATLEARWAQMEFDANRGHDGECPRD